MTTIDRYKPPATKPATQAPLEIRQPSAGDDEPGIGEMLGRLHLMMRGKYLLCGALAILLGGGLALAGYKAGEKTYRSSGQIRIVPTLPRIMYQTENTGVMPMFDSFVQTQVSLIRTQRVIESALEDRSWSPPPPRDDRAVADFASRLVVARDNEIIHVAFDDADPTFAQSAVKTVISAYRRLYQEADTRENETVLKGLDSRQSTLNSEQSALQKRIDAINERWGSVSLDTQIEQSLEAVKALQQRVAGWEQEAALVQRFKSAADVSVDEMAAQDPRLAKLRDERDATRDELQRMRLAMGPGNERLKIKDKELAMREEALDAYVAAKRNGGDNKGNADRVADELARAKKDLADEQQRVRSLSQDRAQLVDLQARIATVNERLTQTQRRIDELSTEAPLATGRIVVVSSGDRPLVPARDTRKTYAAAAGLVGFVFPFGAALLLAGTSRRYGAPIETRMHAITRDLVLGALPSVDEATFNAETSELAAHCLHQVRTMLQIRCNGHAKAIAITSSNAGSGKTSLVLGLGVSYAMAGSRTLLIDLDLVGGGLTRRAEVQARARLGQLLLGQGLVTADQLEKALELAKERSLKLGEAFVALKFLSEEQLGSILEDQKRSHVGLMDALYGSPVKDCVTSAGMSGLDILPLGSANAHDAATLSPTEIKSLIDEAKAEYDTVLIDTGPVPGSLEASMVSSMTDAVLLVVARGENRGAAEASIEHLRRIGGRVAGLVFNRARASDAGIIGGSLYQGSSGGQSLRPVRPAGQIAAAARQSTFARFGPVGQAVMDLAPPAVAGT